MNALIWAPRRAIHQAFVLGVAPVQFPSAGATQPIIPPVVIGTQAEVATNPLWFSMWSAQ